MGANLCCFRDPSTSTTDHHDDHDNQNKGKDRPKEPSSHIASCNMVNPTSSSAPRSAITGLIRQPGCLDQMTTGHLDNQKAERRTPLLMNLPAEKKSSKVRKITTLEDWLMNSPGMSNRPDCLTGGELYVSRHSSRKVHPSSSSSSSSSRSSTALLASKAIDSIILEPVAKSGCNTRKDGGAQVVELGGPTSSLSRSRSGKLAKKVSFREEPEIIFIYSPEEAGYLE